MDKFTRNSWGAFENWRLPLGFAAWKLAMILAGLAVAACGGGGGGSGGFPSQQPIVSFTTGQDASVVVGQPDFDTGTAGGPGADAIRLRGPRVRAFVVGGTLFIPDFNNNRVVGFNTIPTTNGASADFAVGQPNLTSNIAGTDVNLFRGPSAIASDGSMLFVAEDGNKRVLIFNSIPTVDNPSADVVLGQADFTSRVDGSLSCGPTVMGNFQLGPRGVWAAGGRLIVADTGNSRVLIWNTIPNTNAAPADLALGQPDLATCGAGVPTGASTFNQPGSVWSDGTRLVVGDTNNNRVLIWNTFPTVNGQAADVVVGQPDFATNTQGDTDSVMDVPYANSNGTQLFVGDDDNNRVLIWNAFPTINGQAADVVLGQSGFTFPPVPPPPPWQAGTSINELNGPNGILPVGNRLIVTDSLNNRVLIFQGN